MTRRLSAPRLHTHMLLLILLAAVPLVIVMLINTIEQRSANADQVRANAMRLAQVSALGYERLVEGTRQTLLALSRVPSVRDSDVGACNALFVDLLHQFSNYSNLMAIDSKGQVFCTAVPLTAPVSVGGRSWFQMTLQTRAFTISDYHIDEITHKPVFALAYPVADESGKLLGVVTSIVDIEWLNQLVGSIGLPANASITIFDRTGTILARAPDPATWVGRSAEGMPLFNAIRGEQKSGTATVLGLDDHVGLYGFTSLVGSESSAAAYLAVGFPLADAYAGADRTLRRKLMVLTAITALGLIAASLMADRWFVRRVARLARTAERLGAGEWSARTGQPNDDSELGLLAGALDNMAAALERHEARRNSAKNALLLEVAEHKRTENTLRQVRDHLQAILDTTPAAISWVGADLHYQGINRTMADFLGWQNTEVAGEPIGPIDSFPELADFVSDFFESDSSQATCEMIRTTGDVDWIYLITARKYSAGQSAVLVGVDVTELRAAEIGLRQSDERYRTFIAYSSEAIWRLEMAEPIPLSLPEDAQLQFLYKRGYLAEGNKAMALLHGYADVSEIIGRSLHDMSPSLASHHAHHLRTFIRSGYRALEAEIDETDHHGAPRRYWSHLVGVLKDDCLVRVWGVQRDITYRMRAEEEIRRLNRDLEQRVTERTAQLGAANAQLRAEVAERRRAEVALRSSESRLRLLIEQANDAIFVEDDDDNIVDVNSRACEMLGYDRAELLSMKVSDLLPSEIRGELGQVVKARLASDRVVETVNIRKDGTRVPLEISTRRIVGVPENLVLTIARDITRRKLEEEAIRTALTKEKELSELRSRFISTTSHEFRTPLSTILASAQLLERHAARISQERQALHLRHIQAAARQMAELLTDLLTLTRIDAGKAKCEPAPFDLPELCAALVEEVRVSDQAGVGIQLTVHSERAVVLLDEKLLRCILQNLLSNALKYSAAGSTVLFDVDIRGDEAIFSIRDQGIGIPEDEQAHLFEPFYRASNVADTPGSGLGMSIAKNSVDLHGGTIVVDSRVGAGTLVTVNIPIPGIHS